MISPLNSIFSSTGAFFSFSIFTSRLLPAACVKSIWKEENSENEEIHRLDSILLQVQVIDRCLLHPHLHRSIHPPFSTIEWNLWTARECPWRSSCCCSVSKLCYAKCKTSLLRRYLPRRISRRSFEYFSCWKSFPERLHDRRSMFPEHAEEIFVLWYFLHTTKGTKTMNISPDPIDVVLTFVNNNLFSSISLRIFAVKRHPPATNGACSRISSRSASVRRSFTTVTSFNFCSDLNF